MTPGEKPTDPPTVSLNEAAKLANVTKPTIRRRADALKAHGAVITDTGWTIPIPALVAVGLLDRVTSTPVSTPVSPPVEAPVKKKTPGVAIPPVEIDPARERFLMSEVETWRRRAEVAEAVAEERGHTNEALRMALRMLEPTKPSPADEQAALLPTRPEVTPKLAEVERRRWWRREA